MGEEGGEEEGDVNTCAMGVKETLVLVLVVVEGLLVVGCWDGVGGMFSLSSSPSSPLSSSPSPRFLLRDSVVVVTVVVVSVFPVGLGGWKDAKRYSSDLHSSHHSIVGWMVRMPSTV